MIFAACSLAPFAWLPMRRKRSWPATPRKERLPAARQLLLTVAALLTACRCALAEDPARASVARTDTPEVYRLPPADQVSWPGVMDAPVREPALAPVPTAEPPYGPVPLDDAVSLEAAPAFPAAQPTPPPKLWEGSVELGLDGSQGNSQTFNLRFGANLKRKSKYHVLSADLDYHKNSNDSVETANRAFLDWRYERLFDPSPWTWYVHGTVDYDEFKAFDVRVSVDTGVGYQLIKTEATSFLGRFGGGFSREIGGPDDRYVPELVFGMEFEHQLTKRQKLTAKADYMPDVTDFDNFRLTGEFGWQVLLDEAMNLSLKASLLDRYDSTPDGAKPNDLDYALTLLWSY